VAAGAAHTIGLKEDGTVVAVGYDKWSQLEVDDWDLMTDPYVDGDGDGFTENQGDCDDNDNLIYPGAQEICGDNIDQDCDESDKICPNLQSVYFLLLGK
jgi:alpha-tubulin suppressor-like RCC1 family protein